MNFRSIAQLSDQLVAWTKRLPPDIDVVVGIPRSGMLVASIVACYRSVPLTDVDGFVEGRCFRTGRTKAGSLSVGGAEEAHLRFLEQPRRALVLDDSVWSGGSIRRTRERIEAAGLPHDVVYGAVYVRPGKTDIVDHYCEVLNGPRLFEWNFLQHEEILADACVDIDGVLCYDPSAGENDDGERYRRFLREARPLFRPEREVGWLVTSRLERYRAETEAWLQEHEIAYRELVMLDCPDGSTRRRLKLHGAHKASVYRETGASLFIESEVRQAVEIANLAQRPVLCTDTMQLIQPGALPLGRPAVALADASVPSLPRRVARRVAPLIPAPVLSLLLRSNGRRS